MKRLSFILVFLGICLTITQIAAQTLRIPILVPITGFLALEGTSQRNGALLALELSPYKEHILAQVIDTGTSLEGARTAFWRAMDQGTPLTIAATMLGTQMLSLLPLADKYRVPLVTISGTSGVTERKSRYVFRFFPADSVTKYAHARYVWEVLKAQRPALFTQTTAYGQSGRKHLLQEFHLKKIDVVADETLDTRMRNTIPLLRRVMRHNPDVFLLHLHARSTALIIRHMRLLGMDIPIVAGSAIHQPATVALLKPEELQGVCGETASSPVSQDTPEIKTFSSAYRERFAREPDAFALGQFDGMNMVLQAVKAGARKPQEVRDWLAQKTYKGIAMTYSSDGRGNMAHSSLIICYDGMTRIPRIVKRYTRSF